SHFRQNPVRSRKKSKTSDSSLFMTFIRLGSRKKSDRRIYRRRSIEGDRRRSGFSFPAPSLATLVIIAGIVVIALAAFNWEEIDIKMPDISSADFQEAFVFQPLTSAETENHTMRYAATGITSILPSINTNNTTTAAEIPDASNAVTNIEEIPQETDAQNDLITFQWQQYRVKKGDSVSVIAQRHGVSVGAIIASNEIRNARTLREGATIRIPNIDGIPYQIKTGDSLSKIAASFNVPLEVILDVNDIKSDIIKAGETIFIPGARMNDIDLRLSLGELFIYPVQSKYVTSRYGMRKDPINGALNFHTGIDLRANTGESVMAALDGVVSVVTENWLYGKYIILTHDNGYKTLYAHLHNFNVKQGDRVARGRKIGEAGNTGYSTGSHLHFGIYDKNNKLINPLDLLR
ncbi:MAG: M23 family metallopeptidase, partial [Treponema sp.]|nr:M23 family metallopeptidase [Treponema sp.]